jgi:hypothetical protein
MRTSSPLIRYLGRGILVRGFLLLVCLVDFKQGSIILQTSFGVLGILYSIAVSTAVSIDLTKVRNKIYRNRYRKGIQSIVYALTIDLLLTSLLIIIGLLFKATSIQVIGHCFHISYSTWGILSSLLSLITEAYSFIQLLQFKDELSERIIGEEDK